MWFASVLEDVTHSTVNISLTLTTPFVRYFPGISKARQY
jgi:hypothetical protein